MLEIDIPANGGELKFEFRAGAAFVLDTTYILCVKIKLILNIALKLGDITFYSPSPEYPVACCSEAEIPPAGLQG